MRRPRSARSVHVRVCELFSSGTTHPPSWAVTVSIGVGSTVGVTSGSGVTPPPASSVDDAGLNDVPPVVLVPPVVVPPVVVPPVVVPPVVAVSLFVGVVGVCSGVGWFGFTGGVGIVGVVPPVVVVSVPVVVVVPDVDPVDPPVVPPVVVPPVVVPPVVVPPVVVPVPLVVPVVPLVVVPPVVVGSGSGRGGENPLPGVVMVAPQCMINTSSGGCGHITMRICHSERIVISLTTSIEACESDVMSCISHSSNSAYHIIGTCLTIVDDSGCSFIGIKSDSCCDNSWDSAETTHDRRDSVYDIDDTCKLSGRI